jgi:hypothetical protein
VNLIEGAQVETDTVHAATTYRLAQHLKTLTLLDAVSYDSFGNAVANTISDNRLSGPDGNVMVIVCWVVPGMTA